MSKSNIIKDTFFLSFANIISVIALMIQSMVLTRILTKYEYGTYSQVLTIIAFITSFSSLGLNDAINYFIPKSKMNDRITYLNNIFTVLLILGVFCFLIMIFCSPFFANYFNNKSLLSIICIAAVRPLFYGVINGFINMFVAYGKSELVAKRNVFINTLSTLIICTIALLFERVITIYLSIAILDIVQFIYFNKYIQKHIIKISYNKIDFKVIRKIMYFSIPMAIATACGSLLKSIDSIMIGKFFDTVYFGIYSAVGKELPFSLVSTAIITVIRPRIVILYNNQKTKIYAFELWQKSIELSAIITWCFCFAALLVSKELLIFLYSDKYLEGLIVFRIYIILQMIRITYYGMIINASGKSKLILKFSIFTLMLNIVLNILFLLLFGFCGPAIASVLSFFIMGIIQILFSAYGDDLKLNSVVNIKNLFYIFLIYFILFIIFIFIKMVFIKYISCNYLVCLFLFGISYSIVSVIIFNRKLKQLFKLINKGENYYEG